MLNECFRITGGYPVSGKIRPSGNKNAALPLLAATLLTEEEVCFHNMPRIRDVEVMMELLVSLGANVSREGHTVRVRAKEVNPDKLSQEDCKRIRGSVLFAGPMLARAGRITLPPPGGDVIGRRRLDTHVLALKGLGAEVVANQEQLYFSRGTNEYLKGQDLFLDEASVTGTENAIMAAVLAKGRTQIDNAAGEPHVQDLCKLLVLMGAQIQGAGTNRLIIHGVEKLKGAEFTLGPDYIEVGSLITLAAVTGGELILEDARPEEHRATKMAFQRIGIEFYASENGKDIIVPKEQKLKVEKDLFGAVPKIEDSIWPGFPADLTSIAVVGATQSQGTVLIHEKMFESRLYFVDRLNSMGASTILCDPHRVVITGKADLVAQELVSPDIRAGMALVIAALTAQGTSVIHNIHQIDRGYESIDTRLAKLGAKIERVKA